MNATGRLAIEREKRWGAHTYAPLNVVLSHGEGIFVWDTEGNVYIDMMSAYSAVSHGHCHPRLMAAFFKQVGKFSIVSRAFYTEPLGLFLEKACQLTGQDAALPKVTGAESVETAVKAARKWGYVVKGIPKDKAEIIVCEGNFHGRTTTIIGFSSEEQYRFSFGPFTPGFKIIPYGDAAALKEAITENTCAFLVEPIQGEAGIIIPPEGYLRECFEACRQNNILFIADEVQTGLGRTGKLLACDHEGVKPDGLILGKALGGGILPVSLFLAKREVMNVFTPGNDGSTFGGNPLAAAVGLEALNVLVDENMAENSALLGKRFLERLQAIRNPIICEVRGRGLFIGVEVCGEVGARAVCEELLRCGILSKDVHSRVIRFAPPLVITEKWIDEVFRRIVKAFSRWSEWKKK